MKKNYTLFGLIFLGSNCLSQTTIFVDQSNSGGQQNGTSWENSFSRLQEAFAIANYGDQIWIAKGVYYPTFTNDRTKSFDFENGVKVLGGFNGTETNENERNPQANITRLSGNIGDAALMTDNSIHVARGKGLDVNTIIDGLIFSDGYSVGAFGSASDPDGAGFYLVGSSELNNSTPVISNCIFENNKAGGAGGGMVIAFVDQDDPFQVENKVNPVLINCIFRDNNAVVFGGAIAKQGPSGMSDTFNIVECQFLRNGATQYDGGAIYFASAQGSNIVIRDCLFENNATIAGSGGGFFLPTSYPGGYTTSLFLQNCVFKGNSAAEGGGFSVDGSLSSQPNVTINLSMIDCLFEGNISKNSHASAFLVTHDQTGIVNTDIRFCRFIGNSAYGYFTAAVLTSGDCISNILLESSLFLDNFDLQAPNSYCAAFSAGGTKNIHTKINNCVFAHNANAIFAGGSEEAKVTTDITNCTFFRNGTQPFGKRWYPSFNQAGAMYYNRMNFKNCVIWEDLGNPSFMFYNNYPDIINGFGFKLDYCSLNPFNPAVIPNAIVVLGDSIYMGGYPAFADTSNLDFRLDKCSFAINKGSNAAAADAGLLTDLDGLPRVRFDTVDLGAYEQQISCIVSTATNPTLMQALLISPNPGAGELLSFQLPDSAPASGHLRIYAANGAVVKEQTLSLERNNQVYLPKLPPGCYNVLLSTGKTAFVGKWVVVD